MNTKRTLRLLAPYLAVGVFWCGFSSAWLAILAYHAQVLLWSHGRLRGMRWGAGRRVLLLALPTAIVGPLVHHLLPLMTDADLSAWLAGHGLSRLSLAAMIPYFGLMHPFLEQLHWAPLREETPLAHPLFAGYHVLVLHSLLAVPWLVVCFAVLTAASAMWHRMAGRTGGLAGPVVSHALADLGIAIAAWLST